ncbi:MAG: C1 family peptidase [Polyangiaceae bacterium]
MRVASALIAAASLSILACSPASSRPSVAPPPQPVLPQVAAPPVHVSAVQSLQGTVRCAPVEVAPGEYASFDCTPHRDVMRALMPTMRMGFVAGPLPPFVDHRVTGLEGPVRSQGAVGTCTAMSLSTAMDHAVRKMGRPDVLSALHVWSKYAVGSMGVAGDQTEGERITLEGTWPYDPVKACKMLREPLDSCGKAYGVSSGTGDLDPMLRAERTRADVAGKYRIAAIEQLRSRPADLDEMAAVLAGGDAVWAAFSVNDDAWKSRNLQTGAVIPDYEADGGAGHAVVLAGYRTVNGHRQFLVHNSWGPRWGDGGYGWLSDTMVQRYLRAAYKVRIAEGGGNSPGPNPNNGCPQGQAPDSVTGSCAPMCDSGSPPAAGVCLPSIPGITPGGLPSIPGMPAPSSIPLPFPVPSLPGFPPLNVPTPGPAPQSGSCPQGQVADVVTQKCASPCPGGAPPMGGLCMPALPR